MVKRYPHMAIISIEREAEFESGKYVPSCKSYSLEIKGRYDPDGKTIKKNDTGNEKIVKGSFYSKYVPSIGKIIRIKIESLNIDEPVLSIDYFQTHTIISI
ncbi:hypothetical protein DWW69_09655 [Bacteroides sp. AF16-49]|nr:hypothetical protein DWW69_09655 [Bacteroides sp. AF16-49]